MRPRIPRQGAVDPPATQEILRPAVVVPEEAVRAILVELSVGHVDSDGMWRTEPGRWDRYDRPPDTDHHDPELVGSIQIAYGTPSKYDITIYRVTITPHGHQKGWTVRTLCDDALAHGGLSLDRCPRAPLQTPSRPFRH